MFSDAPDLLTIQAVAEILHVSTRTVQRMLDDGRLPATKIEGLDRTYVRRADLASRMRTTLAGTPVEDAGDLADVSADDGTSEGADD